MTPTEAERIGRAWRAAGGPWLARMRGVDRKGNGFTILVLHPFGDALVHDDRVATSLLPVRQAMLEQCWPDPRDPATVGCMLAIVRERYGDSSAYAVRDVVDWDRPWTFCANIDPDDRGKDGVAHGESEAEALVAALVAVPKGAQP